MEGEVKGVPLVTEMTLLDYHPERFMSGKSDLRDEKQPEASRSQIFEEYLDTSEIIQPLKENVHCVQKAAMLAPIKRHIFLNSSLDQHLESDDVGAEKICYGSDFDICVKCTEGLNCCTEESDGWSVKGNEKGASSIIESEENKTQIENICRYTDDISQGLGSLKTENEDAVDIQEKVAGNVYLGATINFNHNNSDTVVEEESSTLYYEVKDTDGASGEHDSVVDFNTDDDGRNEEWRHNVSDQEQPYVRDDLGNTEEDSVINQPVRNLRPIKYSQHNKPMDIILEIEEVEEKYEKLEVKENCGKLRKQYETTPHKDDLMTFSSSEEFSPDSLEEYPLQNKGTTEYIGREICQGDENMSGQISLSHEGMDLAHLLEFISPMKGCKQTFYPKEINAAPSTEPLHKSISYENYNDQDIFKSGVESIELRATKKGKESKCNKLHNLTSAKETNIENATQILESATSHIPRNSDILQVTQILKSDSTHSSCASTRKYDTFGDDTYEYMRVNATDSVQGRRRVEEMQANARPSSLKDPYDTFDNIEVKLIDNTYFVKDGAEEALYCLDNQIVSGNNSLEILCTQVDVKLNDKEYGSNKCSNIVNGDENTTHLPPHNTTSSLSSVNFGKGFHNNHIFDSQPIITPPSSIDSIRINQENATIQQYENSIRNKNTLNGPLTDCSELLLPVMETRKNGDIDYVTPFEESRNVMEELSWEGQKLAQKEWDSMVSSMPCNASDDFSCPVNMRENWLCSFEDTAGNLEELIRDELNPLFILRSYHHEEKEVDIIPDDNIQIERPLLGTKSLPPNNDPMDSLETFYDLQIPEYEISFSGNLRDSERLSSDAEVFQIFSEVAVPPPNQFANDNATSAILESEIRNKLQPINPIEYHKEKNTFQSYDYQGDISFTINETDLHFNSLLKDIEIDCKETIEENIYDKVPGSTRENDPKATDVKLDEVFHNTPDKNKESNRLFELPCELNSSKNKVETSSVFSRSAIPPYSNKGLQANPTHLVLTNSETIKEVNAAHTKKFCDKSKWCMDFQHQGNIVNIENAQYEAKMKEKEINSLIPKSEFEYDTRVELANNAFKDITDVSEDLKNGSSIYFHEQNRDFSQKFPVNVEDISESVILDFIQEDEAVKNKLYLSHQTDGEQTTMEGCDGVHTNIFLETLKKENHRCYNITLRFLERIAASNAAYRHTRSLLQ
ncbi:hypothetical protein SK128_016589, partial [Halocaridina rubra]